MPAASKRIDPTNDNAIIRLSREQLKWDGLSRVVYRKPSGDLGIVVTRLWNRRPGGRTGEDRFVAQTGGITTYDHRER